MNEIFFWSKSEDYSYLSNFHYCFLIIDGKIYKTVEHYYQSQKSLDEKIREEIRCCQRPSETKAYGKKVELRPDWETVKDEVLLRALRTKFRSGELRQRLLDTGDAVLHEDSPNDKYWGYYNGQGKDKLGKLLMQVRNEILSKE